MGCPLNTQIPEEVNGEVFTICLLPKNLSNCMGEDLVDNSTDDLECFDFFIELFPEKIGPKPAILIRYLDLLLGK